jgi:hypothetical protein
MNNDVVFETLAIDAISFWGFTSGLVLIIFFVVVIYLTSDTTPSEPSSFISEDRKHKRQTYLNIKKR